MAYKEMKLPKEGAEALSKMWGKANDKCGGKPSKGGKTDKKKPAPKGKK